MYLALSKNLDFYKKGVAIQSLSGQALSSILIPLPPLAEQHRIVSVIESAFALIDEIEESKTSLEQIIKHAKAKTLELAIKGKLCTDTACRVPSVSTADNSPYAKAITNYETTFGVSQLKITNAPFEVPEGWKWCRFSDLFILLSGRDLEKKEFNDKGEGIPYLIGASNVINGKLDINRWTTVPKVISLKNDLLLSCKGTVGELIINELDKIHIARQFMAIRSNANVNIYYTKYCFLYSINTIKESAKGIIPGISRTDILDLLIPLPPLAEQKLIVERIETIFNTLDSIQKNL
jgi:type I restriction enzyme S subunit